MKIEIRNYIRLRHCSLLYRSYAYIDCPEYIADSLFVRHRVTVHFGHEMVSPSEPYIFVFCKIRKKDEKEFLNALAELPEKMLICGHSDYEDFCRETIDRINASAFAERSEQTA